MDFGAYVSLHLPRDLPEKFFFCTRAQIRPHGAANALKYPPWGPNYRLRTRAAPGISDRQGSASKRKKIRSLVRHGGHLAGGFAASLQNS